jgi:hypothetical protein
VSISSKRFSEKNVKKENLNEKLDMVYNYCITIWIKARSIANT